VCLLIGGVDLHYLLPPSGRLEQPQVQGAQPVPRLLGPRRVAVLGEQLPLIGVERANSPGASGRLEARRVHAELPVGAQLQHCPASGDRGHRAEGGTRKMNGFAQVASRRVGCKIGPEQVHDLFAVQAMRVGQREDLDQFGCPLVPPCVSGHRLAVDTNHELAQQPDLVAGHHSNIDGQRPGGASLAAGLTWQRVFVARCSAAGKCAEPGPAPRSP
jgi:hypothetical protein